MMEPSSGVELVAAFSTHIEDKHSHWAEMLDELGSQPTGLAIGHCGEYLVVDRDTKVVKVFDHTGEFTHAFGHKVLKCPADVTVTASGKIVVTDQGAGDVKVFSCRGKLLVTSELGMHLLRPYGIDYSPYTKQICVCDQGANCVFVHDPSGVVQNVLTLRRQKEVTRKTAPKEDQPQPASSRLFADHRYGHPPSDTHSHTHSGSLTSPNLSHINDISVDSLSDNNSGRGNKRPAFSPAHVKFDPFSPNIFVSDHATHNVYVFDHEGEILQKYPSKKLQSPSGLCVHKNGDLFVADTDTCTILRLDRHGQMLGPVVTWEDGLGDPQALAINRQGHLVVTEGNTGLVKIYRI